VSRILDPLGHDVALATVHCAVGGAGLEVIGMGSRAAIGRIARSVKRWWRAAQASRTVASRADHGAHLDGAVDVELGGEEITRGVHHGGVALAAVLPLRVRSGGW
jgi:hypothetical protein